MFPSRSGLILASGWLARPGSGRAWLQAATIAIVSKTPVELLWQAVPAFPTRSEIWLKLLERREAELPSERAAKSAA